MGDLEVVDEKDKILDSAVRAAYRAAPAADAGAEARVLARIRLPGPRWALSPLAVAAVVLIALGIGAWAGVQFEARRMRVAATGTAAVAAAAGVPVTFVLRAPGASRVSVAGDFNNWDASATPLAHTGSGDMWLVRVNVPRGVHLYSFVLDGAEWRPDPSAPLAADAAFGGHNSVIVVSGVRDL